LGHLAAGINYVLRKPISGKEAQHDGGGKAEEGTLIGENLSAVNARGDVLKDGENHEALCSERGGTTGSLSKSQTQGVKKREKK